MKAIKAHFKITLFLFILVIHCNTSFTQITPWGNTTVHFGILKSMSLSDDGKYLLMADQEGYISIRDFETKKVIRSHHLTELAHAFFEPNTYNIIAIHSEFAGDLGKSIFTISKIHYKQVEEQGNIERLFTRANEHSDFKIDVSPNREKLLVLHEDFLEEIRFTSEGAKAFTFFEAEEAHYTSDNKVHKSTEFDLFESLIVDGNNKTMIWQQPETSFLCSDHINNYQVQFDPNKLFGENREDIFEGYNFFFSPGGKSVLISSQTMGGVDLALLKKSGDEYKRRWTRKFDKRDYIMNFGREAFTSLICWVDNNTFLFSAEPRGTAIMQSNNQGEVDDYILNDYRVYPSIDFTNDLSKLVFSYSDGNSYELDLKNSENINLIDTSHNFVCYTDEDNIRISKKNKKNGTCKFELSNTIENDIQTIDSTHFPFSKIIYTSYFIEQNSICYYVLSGNTCGFKELTPDELLLDDSGNQIGFRIANVRYFSNKQEHLTGSTNLPILDLSGTHLILYDKLTEDKIVLLNTSFCESATMDMSSDKRFLSWSCADMGFSYSTFDLQEKRYVNYGDDLITSLYYSQSSTLAFSLTVRGNMTIWDHSTNDTLYTNNLGFEANQEFVTYQFIESENILLYQVGREIFSLHYKEPDSKAQLFFSSAEALNFFQLSKDEEYLFYESWDVNFITTTTTVNIFNRKTLESIYSYTFEGYQSNLSPDYEHVYFSNSDPYVFLYNGIGEFRLINLNDGSLLFTLKLLGERDWLAYTPQGYFDASNKGRESLYYVLGDEVILYNQIKERFWKPGLMAKILENPEYLKGQTIESLDLFPETKSLSLINASEIELTLEPRSGGIGKTSLYINDKEVSENINPDTVLNLVIDLNDYEQYLYKSGLNIIGVKNYNKEEWVSSRTQKLYTEPLFATAKDTTTNRSQHKVSNQRRRRSSSIEKPGLFALFIGTSEYSNPKLNLDFADKDALELKIAFDKIGKDFYKISGHKPVTLTSTATNTDSLSSRENILRELTFIEENAHINDIVVLFLSGHGITIDDDFYYLTSKAGNINLNKNVTGRKQVCISSKEILESLRRIKANKQILVFDACHSGKIAEFLSNKSKALSTSQKKALESIKDKMGIYILASSEANQKSFEVQKLNQGLLTHSLLLGMSGQADKSDVTIDIVKLLSYASLQTEEVSKSVLGISQRPVIGIGEGGSSFSIGFKNESLKPPIPSDYVKIGNGKFGILPSLHDPINLQNTFNNVLNDQGVFGGTQEFIYLENDFKQEAHKLTGTYEILANGELKIKLYILKEHVFLGGPFEFQTSKKELKVTINKMIQEAVSFIKASE